MTFRDKQVALLSKVVSSFIFNGPLPCRISHSTSGRTGQPACRSRIRRRRDPADSGFALGHHRCGAEGTVDSKGTASTRNNRSVESPESVTIRSCRDRALMLPVERPLPICSKGAESPGATFHAAGKVLSLPSGMPVRRSKFEPGKFKCRRNRAADQRPDTFLTGALPCCPFHLIDPDGFRFVTD